MVLFSRFNGFSQEKFIQHVVAKGETISKIAQRYNVDAVTIYQINPNAKEGIKVEEILLVPFVIGKEKKSETTAFNSAVEDKKHVVLAKETMYGIAKQYGVKVADLYKLNPNLESKGLQVGNTIQIPVLPSNAKVAENKKPTLKTDVKEVLVEEKKDVLTTTPVDADGNYVKEVVAKETLYGIAREYGVLVADLEKANPILETQSLRIGQKLIIPKTSSQQQQIVKQNSTASTEEVKAILNKKATEVKETVVVAKKEKEDEVEIIREVLAKETKYGIAREFGLTVKELEAQNPTIVNKLSIGDKLTIRTSKSNVKTPARNVANTEESLDNKELFKPNSFLGADFADQLISTASENIGVRYRSGGTSKDGFDCSGLMCTTFGAYDIQLPRSSFEQAQYGVKIDTEDAKKGDLVFFKTNGRSRINHVGMVVEVGEDGEIKFIHASVGNGVIISSNKESYYSKRLTQVNRVF